MGWRDRVKKSFGDFENIGDSTQNLKKSERRRKKGLKRTFRHYPQNTQNPQNRKKEDEKPKPDQAHSPREVKTKSTLQTAAQKIPAPEPPGMGAEYTRLWNQAWVLADWIDNPDGAPLAERRAKLPELNRLRDEMAAIERQTVPPAGPDPEPAPTDPKGTWTPWEGIPTTRREPIPDTCPAKNKRSGKCYAAAYFQGKPGKAIDCDPDGCIYIKDERGSHDS